MRETAQQPICIKYMEIRTLFLSDKTGRRLRKTAQACGGALRNGGNMIEQDTVKLLKECDAGVKMGADSIGDVLEYVHDRDLKKLLSQCREEHLRLGGEVQKLLEEYHDDGKDPNPMAKGMSWMKTNVKLVVHESDSTIADLMTDGCNMGVKSLNRYLNQYKAADERSKDIAKKLIKLEEKLTEDMRDYL